MSRQRWINSANIKRQWWRVDVCVIVRHRASRQGTCWPTIVTSVQSRWISVTPHCNVSLGWLCWSSDRVQKLSLETKAATSKQKGDLVMHDMLLRNNVCVYFTWIWIDFGRIWLFFSSQTCSIRENVLKMCHKWHKSLFRAFGFFDDYITVTHCSWWRAMSGAEVQR